jgi:hypothetical protein
MSKKNPKTIKINLREFVRENCVKWAKISQIKGITPRQKSYAAGCMMAYLSVEDKLDDMCHTEKPDSKQTSKTESTSQAKCQHNWIEETLREPNFQVAFGRVRTCKICGKEQYANYAEGRVGEPFRDVSQGNSNKKYGDIGNAKKGSA